MSMSSSFFGRSKRVIRSDVWIWILHPSVRYRCNFLIGLSTSSKQIAGDIFWSMPITSILFLTNFTNETNEEYSCRRMRYRPYCNVAKRNLANYLSIWLVYSVKRILSRGKINQSIWAVCWQISVMKTWSLSSNRLSFFVSFTHPTTSNHTS